MSIFTERKNYKPFEYSHITDPLINAMWAGHWTHNEFNFLNDVQDYKTKFTEEERQVIKKAILLTSQVEVAVKSYWSNIGKLLPKPEIADMGAVFGGVEVIHSKAYAEILTKLGLEAEFQELFTERVVTGRVDYLSKYVNIIYKNDHKNICYSLVLFTLFTEYTALFSQFYIILGFNRFNGVLKDVANVVQYTSKEENLHAEGGIALLLEIKKEEPELFDQEFSDKIKEEVAFDKMNNKLSDAEISILYLIRSSLPNPNECEDKTLIILYSENLAFKNSKYSSNNKSFLTEFEFEKKEVP